VSCTFRLPWSVQARVRRLPSILAKQVPFNFTQANRLAFQSYRHYNFQPIYFILNSFIFQSLRVLPHRSLLNTTDWILIAYFDLDLEQPLNFSRGATLIRKLTINWSLHSSLSISRGPRSSENNQSLESAHKISTVFSSHITFKAVALNYWLKRSFASAFFKP
jgi:hypothetical protein